MKALACIALVVTLLGASASVAEVEGIQDDALPSATPSSDKAAFAAWYHAIKPAEEDSATFFEWYNSAKKSESAEETEFSEFNDGLNHRYLNKLEGKYKTTKKKSTKKTKASKKATSKKASKSSKAHHSMISERLLPPVSAAVPANKLPFQEDDDHLIPKRGSPPEMAVPARHPLLAAARKDEETQFAVAPSSDNRETRRLKRHLKRMEDSVEANEDEDDSETLGDYYGELDKPKPHTKQQKHVEEIEASGNEKEISKNKKRTPASGNALDLVGDEIEAIGAEASAQEDFDDDFNLKYDQDAETTQGTTKKATSQTKEETDKGRLQ